MLSIGIGEIQKNSSVFSTLTEAMQIVDKRKKQVLAVVYPMQNQSIVNSLAGKYAHKIKSTNLTMDEIKESVMMSAMEEKYGLSS